MGVALDFDIDSEAMFAVRYGRGNKAHQNPSTC